MDLVFLQSPQLISECWQCLQAVPWRTFANALDDAIDIAMNIISELSAHGYAQVQDVESIEQALSVTKGLGTLLPLNGSVVQELLPREREEVQSNSFSSRYGRGIFPLHTDTAFWERPARFVVIFSAIASRGATRVLSLRDTKCLMEYARRSNPVFLRKTVRGDIYSHPWEGAEIGALYDPCYMLPVNKQARDFQEATMDAADRSQRLHWCGASVLIIDNWQVMHGRDGCEDDHRVLHRFYRG